MTYQVVFADNLEDLETLVNAALADGWPEQTREKTALKAALALALSFDTWQLLIRFSDLSDGEAVNLMMRLVCDCRANSG